MDKKKRKKYLRSSHVDGKREITCFHVETATGKREKWRENRDHVVIFAVCVPRIRDAKSLYKQLGQSLWIIWRCKSCCTKFAFICSVLLST